MEARLNPEETTEKVNEVMVRTQDVGTPEERIIIFKGCVGVLEAIQSQEYMKVIMQNQIAQIIKSFSK